jgi:hypothetical protein
MHEIKHNERHLGESDKERDQCIGTGKDEIQVKGRDIIRQSRADDQDHKDPEIARDTDVFTLCVIV